MPQANRYGRTTFAPVASGTGRAVADGTTGRATGSGTERRMKGDPMVYILTFFSLLYTLFFSGSLSGVFVIHLSWHAAHLSLLLFEYKNTTHTTKIAEKKTHTWPP